MKIEPTVFAPKLYLKEVAPAMEYYKNAFNAVVLRQWNNNDGSVHVAELAIYDALFHLHEETKRKNELSPHTLNGTPVVIGLFVADPDKLMTQAITAGARELEAIQDYDYGYRQGAIEDPFGHHWVLQSRIG